MRTPYERRSFSDLGRSPYERPSMPPVPSFDRRTDYGGARISTDIYRRRTPPPSSSYGAAGWVDMYSSEFSIPHKIYEDYWNFNGDEGQF